MSEQSVMKGSEGPKARYPFHVLCKPIGPVCNLKCAYCFYLEKKVLYPRGEKWRMSDETLEAFVRQYIEMQPEGAQEVNFAWQGGEPTLMGIDFFRKALAFQKQYARPGMQISNALQTNGTLLDDEWGAFLAENQFLVGISIDGPADIHNHFRLDRVGEGTHDKVMQGLEILKKHKVEFNALVLVNCLNVKEPVKVYEFIKRRGVQFMQFIPLVEFVDHETGEIENERSITAKEWGTFLNGVFDRWREKDIGRVFVQHFDMMLTILMGQPGALCVHSRYCGRNVALEHNGDIYSCDHFVFPEWQLGNLTETPLSGMLDGEFQMKFGRDKSETLPDVCRSCKYLNFCWGGCPNHRVETSSTGEPGLNRLCEGYKAFFSHTMPYFEAMGTCLQLGRQAREYKAVLQAKAAGRPPQQAFASTPTQRHPGMPIGHARGQTGDIGRNDPCPCGSGKKYKKCHGA